MSGNHLLRIEKGCAPGRADPAERWRERLIAHEKRGLSSRYTFSALPAGCERVFFPGCGLSAVRPKTALRVFERLRALDPGLGVVLRCCGRPSLLAGDPEGGRAVARGFLSDMVARGVREIVTGCPGCREALVMAGGPLRVRSAEAVFAEAWAVSGGPGLGVVTIHDPCPTRHDEGARDALRRVVLASGFSIEEMPRSGGRTACCGAGVLLPEKAEAVRRRRIEEAGGRLIVTSCAGCVQNLGGRAVHVLDLLFGPRAALSGGVRPLPAPFGRLGRLWLKGRLGALLGRDGRNGEAA